MNAPRDLPIASVATLRAGATYRAPTGRLCRLVPGEYNRLGAPWGGAFTFRYLDARSRRSDAAPEEFRLSAANVGLLREVVR